MNLSDFLAMGGYAAFVWPSFGLTLIMLILNVRNARRMHALAREHALRRLDAARKPT